MSINQLINELKENGQDFELYPTTKEMIETIYRVANNGNWLDVGAGTCNFKKYFNEISNEYAERYEAKKQLLKTLIKTARALITS